MVGTQLELKRRGTGRRGRGELLGTQLQFGGGKARLYRHELFHPL
jgi:hypothetical protein